MFNNLFKLDILSMFITLFIAFFTIIILIYSHGFIKNRKGLVKYYLYVVLTFLASFFTVLANNLIVFIVFWGLLALLLYLLIEFGQKENTSSTAKKALIIIGGTDVLMLLGIALIWKITGTLAMDKMSIALNSKFAIWAYLCLAAGAFAKAGAMPFHTWVPDTAEDAPVPVTAYLPASLDKLIGIYFLARITLQVFAMHEAMSFVLMLLGSFTIIAAVMMALVQHDLKRLLGFHAVSQVGYMILGIGTCNPIGIAGGLFHMLNNTIYKCCLFLAGGSVEKRSGTSNLDKLGGYAKLMPITFITFLIASLAISGVPPFNGFVSKWMIYQSLIDIGKTGGGYFWILWLVAAVFGSALTLASFMKLIHTVFLGQPSEDKRQPLDSARGMETRDKRQEVGISMLAPTVTLAALCVVFGVFAYRIPLKLFIFPSIEGTVKFTGLWNASLATLLILAGVIVGLIIYLFGTVTKTRETEIFVGGETVEQYPDMRVSGTGFYNTIKDMCILKTIYRLAEQKMFDIYDLGVKITAGFNKALCYLHNGVLPTYLSWCLLGMMILFYVLLR